eukprot:2139779-Pyramimonas_sp.AAC.1
MLLAGQAPLASRERAAPLAAGRSQPKLEGRPDVLAHAGLVRACDENNAAMRRHSQVCLRHPLHALPRSSPAHTVDPGRVVLGSEANVARARSPIMPDADRRHLPVPAWAHDD